MEGLLDSGANCTILGKGSSLLISQLNIKIRPFHTILKTADGTSHSANQIIDLPITFNNRTKVVQTLVVPTIAKPLILGMDFWKTFNIKPVCGLIDAEYEDKIDLSPDERARLEEAISALKSPTPDAPLSRTHLVEHRIDTGDSQPIKQRYYPVSPYVQKEMDDELERMLKLGVIERSNGSWSNPIVGVRKANGKLRLCLDSRKLNAVTKTHAFPLPYISRILGRLRGTKYLSSIDLSDAFWQIPLAYQDREKTAFTVPGRGLFHFVSLPFGLHGAAQSLCRLMDSVLGYDLEPSVFVYLDDIIICTDSFEEHINLLNEVGRRLKAANLSVSKAKSKFCMRQLNYLGYIVNEAGINPNPDKVSAIVNYPAPKNIRDVRRLLGMATWYSRFVSNFATITCPITNMLKKTKAKFEWTDEADSAFNVLKTALISAPVLATPDFSKPFIMHCDASDFGVGAVLTQGSGVEERVIMYMSQKLSSAQIKYSTTEKECLAVLLAIEKFRPYVEGASFTVITDHASLLWLMNVKDPSGRLARWALRLQNYDYTLVHRKGNLHIVPDALSRSVEVIDDVSLEDEEYEKLKQNITDKPEKYPGYQIKDAAIFKYVKEMGRSESSWKLVVPESMRLEILDKLHNAPTSSHGGIRKTLFKIKSKYYWPGMAKEIRNYIRKCEVCQLCKTDNRVLRGEIGQPKDPELPWKMLSVDLVGPLPRSKNGNSYILVVLDVYSKFVLLKPLKKATAKTVIDFIEKQVFLVFGVPKTLICDNGSQFIAKIFKSFLDDYKVRLWYTASYHPQANPVERVNKSIKAALRSYVMGNHKTWDFVIHQIGCALRTAIHSSTNFTPYYVNFGQEMVISGSDYLLNEQIQSLNGPTTERLEEIKRIRGEITASLKKAYELYSKNYNLRARKIVFKKGDIVAKRNFELSDAVKGISSSLNPIYVKCKIKEKTGTNTYRLENMLGKDLGVFSSKDLKPFHE